MHLLLLDNYDSFTYNLYDYIGQTGATCTVVRNDKATISDLQSTHFDAIVLSPGPKRPKDAGILVDLIHHFHLTHPILGICLGHQALGEYFGATLIKGAQPVHGKTSMISHSNHPIFQGIPETLSVMRYHSLLLNDLASTDLIPIAHTDKGEIMGLTHRDLPITGLQFHPESILTQYGLQMIKNWIESLKRSTHKVCK